MVEDVACVPWGEVGQVATERTHEPCVDQGCTAFYSCNGCKKDQTESVSSDGVIYRNGEYASSIKKKHKDHSHTHLSDERVLTLVASHANWNPFLLCFLSCLCRKTRAISDRHLWREFCLSRAPKMVSDLLNGTKNKQIDGGWRALGKLFLYCAGCSGSNSSSHFSTQAVAGHFISETRFSRTSGRFFLIPRCRSDVLYVSDPCEHSNNPEDVGLFRGVFRSFDKSETKKLLTFRRVPRAEDEKCPFCRAGVWSMSRAQMIPKSASTRLAAYDEKVDYSICLNGHLNGKCALLHLSESDDYGEDV